jgi:hypothetical protein
MMSMQRASVLFPLLLALACLPAHAETDEDGRLWINLSAQGEVSGNWGWYFEVQPRWREEGEQFDQLLVRPAISYRLDQRSSLWLGYGRVVSHPAAGGTVDEDRLWQQLLHQFSPWHGVTLSSRTRLEQRWVESGEETGYRLRQMLRATHPLPGVENASVVLWDEVFLNANDTDWGARSGFDQNRFFAGLGYAFTPHAKAEAGYLNQYVNTAATDRMHHVLSVAVNYKF